jgi:hypothetical protein
VPRQPRPDDLSVVADRVIAEAIVVREAVAARVAVNDDERA